jgi:hypothetical protein
LVDASPSIQRDTTRAIEAALKRDAASRRTELDPHADSVVLRYMALSAHYAVGAVLLGLDGAYTPTDLIPLPLQVAGALAYRSVALGPARSGAVRESSEEQARWESESVGGAHSPRSLSVQVFHEHLGVHWKQACDIERANLHTFIDWGLGADTTWLD